jgi:hypothetical protein
MKRHDVPEKLNIDSTMLMDEKKPVKRGNVSPLNSTPPPGYLIFMYCY